MSDVQQSAVSWVAGLLSTSEERENIEKQFQFMDKDQDGRLSFNEIKLGFS